MEPTAWVITEAPTPAPLLKVLEASALRRVPLSEPPQAGKAPFERPALLVVVEQEAGQANLIARKLRTRADLAGVPLLVLIQPGSELTDLDAPLDPMEAVRSPWNFETLRWRLSRVMRVDKGGLPPGQRARTRLLEAVLDHLPDVVGIADMSGLHVVLNAAGRDLGGLKPGDPITRLRPQALHTPEARAKRDEAASTALENEGAWEGETEVQLPDGTVIPAYQMLFRLRDEDGVARYTGSVIRDLRERRALERRLRTAETEQEVVRIRLEAIAAISPDLIGMGTLDGRQIYLNPAGRRLCGYPEDMSIEHRSIAEVHPPESQVLIKEQAIPVAMRDGVWSGETELLHFQEGYRIPVWQTLLAPRGGDGKPIFLATFMRDLRELRALELRVREAEQARERAEDAELAKTRFLANMSHEIRTPLNAVLGYAQLLGTQELTDTQDRYVDHIQDSGQHLLKLIDEVLDLSRIEAGAISFHPEPIELRSLLEAVAAMFTARCANRNLGFTADIQVASGEHFMLDPQRLTQCLANLLDNAVKFTEAGEVRIEARRDGKRLVVSIQDSGPGMTSEEIHRATEAFHQGLAGQTLGGAGLGLAITRALIERMGGRLEMRPREPVGLEARFLIALEAAEDVVAPQHGSAPDAQYGVLAAGLLVLVVDDIAPNREVLREMLTSLGARVITADSGRSAIHLYAESRPDLVYLDIRMPGLDGYQTLELLRARTPSHHAPCVAVTASVVGTTPETFRDRGFSDVIYKPIRLEELADSIQRFHPESTGPRQPEITVPAAEAPLTVVPETLRLALLEAIELQRVSRARILLDEAMVIYGPAFDELCQRLRGLLQRYDFAGLRDLLTDDAAS